MVLLEPQTYVVELAFSRAVRPEDLLRGLADMGWSEVALDQWSLPEDLSPFELRFVGRLARPIFAQNTPFVEWKHVAPLPFDALQEVGDMRLKLFPFELLQGHTYAIRFMSRMLAQPNRKTVVEILNKAGFEPLLLAETRRNTRIPKRPKASVSFWSGVARWTGPHSYVTSDDPFYFEDVIEIDRPPYSPTHPLNGSPP